MIVILACYKWEHSAAAARLLCKLPNFTTHSALCAYDDRFSLFPYSLSSLVDKHTVCYTVYIFSHSGFRLEVKRIYVCIRLHFVHIYIGLGLSCRLDRRISSDGLFYFHRPYVPSSPHRCCPPSTQKKVQDEKFYDHKCIHININISPLRKVLLHVS